MKFDQLIIIVCMFFGSVSVIAEENNVITLAAGEWLPYSGNDIKGGGVATTILRTALRKAGFDLQVDILPWTRMGQQAADKYYQGYFPSINCESSQGINMIASDAISETVLGFAVTTDAALKWSKLSDLAGKNIGMVRGQYIPDDLQVFIQNKIIRQHLVATDIQNLLKLQYKRIDLALIDESVFYYLLVKNVDLAGKVKFHPKVLAEQPLYACFPDTAEGNKTRQILNNALKDIDLDSIPYELF